MDVTLFSRAIAWVKPTYARRSRISIRDSGSEDRARRVAGVRSERAPPARAEFRQDHRDTAMALPDQEPGHRRGSLDVVHEHVVDRQDGAIAGRWAEQNHRNPVAPQCTEVRGLQMEERPDHTVGASLLQPS